MRIGLGILLAALPLAAHHSVRAEFDISKAVSMQGVITHVEWMNPHARFFLDVTGADGTVTNWEVELPPPASLARQGFSKDTYKVGDKVALDVWLAKAAGSKLASLDSLTLPGGRVISGGLGWDNPAKTQ